MKDEQTGLMEEEIGKEDKIASPKQPQITTDKTKNKILFGPIQLFNWAKKISLGIKRPKIITLVILFSVMVATYTALALLASKKEPPPITETAGEIPSPTPKKITDPKLIEIANEVENLKTEIDKQEAFSKDLFPPVLDLNISFK